jgi:UDP-GlcNAc:undecaprenyl-phosphate/decaprenyl-phosphate GlcNAc-1-phosphate transferase
MNVFHFAIPVVIAMLVTLVLCRFAIPISTRLGVLDIPAGRKKHKRATPLMGGIVLLAAFLPAALAIAVTSAPPNHLFKLIIWLLAIAAITLIGLLDDRHSLSPRLRLILSFSVFGFAAFIEPIYNVRILDFVNPAFAVGLGSRWLAIAFTILCCVGLVNAVNMADGKNGLVIGLCFGWLGLLAWRAPPVFIPMIAVLMAVLLVLLVYNMRGQLFLGDGGAYGLAGAIAIIAIAIYNSPGDHATRAISADELVLLFAVPVVDSFRLTYKRIRRGQSPMAADLDHLHHHLLDRFGWPAGLCIYWVVALMPSAIYMAPR